MRKILNIILLGILIFSSVFFIFEKPVRAEWADHAVVSEVQIAGQTVDDEFIELYNSTNTPINLTGHFLKKKTKTGTESNLVVSSLFKDKIIYPHKFLLLARTEYYSGTKTPDIWWPKSYGLTPDNTIILYDSSERVVDKLGWGEAVDFEKYPFPTNPTANRSLERKPGGSEGNGWDANDNSQDFNFREVSDPQNSQDDPRPPLPPPPEPECGNGICEEGENYSNCPQDCPRQFLPSDVVINEFVSDPTDDETEWIELYNKTNDDIDLTNWTIEDGTANPKSLTGLTIPTGDYLVLEKGKNFSFSLNNSGDIIKLKHQDTIIDQVAYGDWDDGNKEDNALATKDPNSVARITDGYDSDQDNADFKISTTPTKGQSNQILNPEEKIYPSGVMLNELLPNPKGDDSENEFIELKNLTDQEIDLENWKLEDAAGTKFVISSQKLPTTKIPAKGFFVLYRKDSKIALNNSGSETLKLYQPNDNLVDFVQYSGTVSDDHSYAHDGSNNWIWSTQATPGQENIIIKVNQKPKAIISVKNKALVNEEIIFDASDSYDPDGDSLTYAWDFGDSAKSAEILAKHTYKKAGKYNIKLEVKDNFGATDTAKLTIEILTGEKINLFSSLEATILITEFLPNPKGSDDQEWLEIYNAGDKEIDLDSWFLDDIDGGSKPYKIKEKMIILPGEYLIFERKETKIALNNNFDSARILDPEGNLFFEVSYEKPKEGFSYAIDENEDWFWTSILTPGQKNLFSPSLAKATEDKSEDKEKFIEVDLAEVRHQDIGDLVKVQGIVSVEPGILGVQIFYLAGSGVQIYSYTKDFPDLKIGDRIEVIGELAEFKGETRIKISSKDDITILKNEKISKPYEVKTGEIGEDLEGSLIVIWGEVIERQTNYFYLDDGSGEVKVYLKATANIKKPKMKDGDWVKVVGIVSQYGEEYRLLPRYQEDIEIIKKPSSEESKNQNNFILGSLMGGSNFPPLNFLSKIISTEYLIVSTLFLLVLLIGLIIKNKK